LIIIAVEWWRPLFSQIRGRCEYEVYSGSWLAIGIASASAAWLAPWPSSPAPSVPWRLRTFGVSAPRCPRVRVHSGNPIITEEFGGTFYRSNLRTTSIINLAFTTPFKTITWGNWHYKENTGSDHEVIGFEGLVNST